MKKIFTSLAIAMAFLFAFLGFACVKAADDPVVIDTTPTTTEVVETTTTTTQEPQDEETPENENEFLFDIDEESLKALEQIMGNLVTGQYKEAYDELKGIVGVSIAVMIASVFTALIFIIKNLRTSKILNAALAKMDAQTQAKVDKTLDEVESKLNDTTDKIMARMGQMDNAQKEKAQDQIKALSNAITGAKAEISE